MEVGDVRSTTTLGDLGDDDCAEPRYRDGGAADPGPDDRLDGRGDDDGDGDDEGPPPASRGRTRSGADEGLARINLDLSGRIACHVLSRRRRDRDAAPPATAPRPPGVRAGKRGDGGGGGAPLICRPPPSSSSSLARAVLLPNDVYVGADYDLDEVWYGVTRWRARCSWGPIDVDVASAATTTTPSGGEGEDGCNGGGVLLLPSTTGTTSSSSATSSSSWTIDVEAERSAFDASDSTWRLGLVRLPPPDPVPSSLLASRGAARIFHNAHTPRRISLDYDSAKRYDDSDGVGMATSGGGGGGVRYAPTVAVDACAPLLHPRLEVRARRTWVVGGGDGDDDDVDDDGLPSCVVRRLESIREMYREGTPRSDPVPSATASSGATTTETGCNGGANRGLGRKISAWLENDGWMPRRVSADLMGNLVSVSEAGFKVDGGGGGGTSTTSPPRRPPSSWRGVVAVPPIRGAGVRLRLSKRIDWTTLGIFPWSGGGSGGGYGERDGGGLGGALDALRSTRARLELCGVYGDHGDGRASVGFDVDPSDWVGTFKFTVCHEDVRLLI
jgi:hypothetical protein